MWSQADKNNMVIEPIDQYGWTLDGNKLNILWDTPENMQSVRDRISVLLKGCKCITGCESKRCSCKKRDAHCSEGCQCINCRNTVHVPVPHDVSIPEDENELASIALEEHIFSEGHQHNDDTDELMDWVFGAETHEHVESASTCSDSDNACTSDED